MQIYRRLKYLLKYLDKSIDLFFTLMFKCIQDEIYYIETGNTRTHMHSHLFT